MNTINLFAVTRINKENLFTQYENILSGRTETKHIKSNEQTSLKILVNNLLKNGINIYDLDGFYFSFTINQISKEFDLLKLSINATTILNIELKSEPIEIDKIVKQLTQNQYYLSHLSNDIHSYTYISSTNELFHLDKDNKLYSCDFSIIVNEIKNFGSFYNENIHNLFKASEYLISPLNTPEKFLNGSYFLTTQQEEYKNNILNQISAFKSYLFISIYGSAGTGKTLLLYDIAKLYTTVGNVCIIHCGILSKGHYFLHSKIGNLDIISIKNINLQTDFSKYKYIFIDEAQRIRYSQLEIIKNTVINKNLCCIYSFDSQQILSCDEQRREICNIITSLSSSSYKLSDKIRTNKELSSFIITLFDLKRKINLYDYKNVNIIYAENNSEASLLLDYYKKQNYEFINFTPSSYNRTTLNLYSYNYNTHEVIGQEFDNVIMILDKNFYYETDGKLSALTHPNPNYLFRQLLFQGVTRTREKLCIIIVENKDLFEQVLSIKRKT